MPAQLTDTEIAHLRDWLCERESCANMKSLVPEQEALAKEIAAKYGLAQLPSHTTQIVAVYDFVRQTVAPADVPLVFSAAIEKAFKF